MRLVDEETNEGSGEAQQPTSLERERERHLLERRIRAFAAYVAKSEEYAALILSRFEHAALDLGPQQQAELERVEESERGPLEEQHRGQRESLARFLEATALALAAVRQRANHVLRGAHTEEPE